MLEQKQVEIGEEAGRFLSTEHLRILPESRPLSVVPVSIHQRDQASRERFSIGGTFRRVEAGEHGTLRQRIKKLLEESGLANSEVYSNPDNQKLVLPFSATEKSFDPRVLDPLHEAEKTFYEGDGKEKHAPLLLLARNPSTGSFVKIISLPAYDSNHQNAYTNRKDNVLPDPIGYHEALLYCNGRRSLRDLDVPQKLELSRQFASVMLQLCEGHDKETVSHARRVGGLTAILAQYGLHREGKLGNALRNSRKKYPSTEMFLTGVDLEASLHDIGKIFIPKLILNAERPLTPEEFSLIKLHPGYGAEIMSLIHYARGVKSACHYHHVRQGTAGYPKNISYENIPAEAKILGVVDSYDALRTERPYKRAYTHDEAMYMLLGWNSGDSKGSFKGHFDNEVLALLQDNYRNIEKDFEGLSAMFRDRDPN